MTHPHTIESSQHDEASPDAGRVIRLMILARQMVIGGAERQIIELAKQLDPGRYALTVVTLYDGGPLWPELAALPQVQLISLAKSGRWETLPFLLRLLQTTRAIQPDIIMGYISIQNELALMVGRLVGARVVWNLRDSVLDIGRRSRFERAQFRLSSWLSRYPDLIIANSYAGKHNYVKHGHDPRRMQVIHNGIDNQRLRPDRSQGLPLRRAWGIADNHHLIGLVGRIAPMKDHTTFLYAAGRLAVTDPTVQFVCVGHGEPDYEAHLRALADGVGLAGRLTWAGQQSDMGAVYNALDIATSSSAFGEGLSNAIAEAMVCGIPVVASDIGDAALLLNQPGRIVPPGHPAALAEAWRELLALSPEQRRAQGLAGRERIVALFSVERLIDQTDAVLRAMMR